MTSKLSVFWAPGHKAERPQDQQFMADLEPYDILILDPDVQDVSDAHRASPTSEITLRVWKLDDNNGAAQRALAADPLATANHIADCFIRLVERMEEEALDRNLVFPPRELLNCHLINEPDSNTLMTQLNAFTVRAVTILWAAGLTADAFNLGSGHPAILNTNGVPDWTPLTQALDVVADSGGYATVHEYYNDLGIQDPSVNPWHIMRHKWAPRGPFYKVGEFGLEMLLNQRMPDHHGWQGIISSDQYIEDHRYYLDNVRDDVIAVRTF
jgi:hypothetical protein